MSRADSKIIARRVYEAFNQRDLHVLDELVARDFVDHTPGEGQAAGVEGIKQAWSRLFSAHPGIHCELEDILAEGDKVAGRVTFRDDTTKPQPTLIHMMEFLRIADGKVVELWNIFKIG